MLNKNDLLTEEEEFSFKTIIESFKLKEEISKQVIKQLIVGTLNQEDFTNEDLYLMVYFINKYLENHPADKEVTKILDQYFT